MHHYIRNLNTVMQRLIQWEGWLNAEELFQSDSHVKAHPDMNFTQISNVFYRNTQVALTLEFLVPHQYEEGGRLGATTKLCIAFLNADGAEGDDSVDVCYEQRQGDQFQLDLSSCGEQSYGLMEHICGDWWSPRRFRSVDYVNISREECKEIVKGILHFIKEERAKHKQ